MSKTWVIGIVIGVAVLVACGSESVADEATEAASGLSTCIEFERLANLVDELDVPANEMPLTNSNVRDMTNEIRDRASGAAPIFQASSAAMIEGIARDDRLVFVTGMVNLGIECLKAGYIDESFFDRE